MRPECKKLEIMGGVDHQKDLDGLRHGRAALTSGLTN